MARLIWILGLLMPAVVMAATTEERPGKHLSYIYSLKLPYAEPRGCGPQWPCSLVRDFNNDGQPDLAQLMEYRGENKRGGNRKLDLILVYSKNDRGELAHEIFFYVGKVSERTPASVYLGAQERGPLKLPGGAYLLERPGINIYLNDDTPFGFHTLYWREGRFIELDKSTD